MDREKKLGAARKRASSQLGTNGKFIGNTSFVPGVSDHQLNRATICTNRPPGS